MKNDYFDKLTIPLLSFSLFITVAFISVLEPLQNEFVAIGAVIIVSGFVLAFRYIKRLEGKIDSYEL